MADYRVLRQPEVEAALDDALGELPEVGDDVELDLENKIYSGTSILSLLWKGGTLGNWIQLISRYHIPKSSDPT